MDAIVRSSDEKRVVEIASRVERPEVVPLGAAPDTW
jgi:hypothetical protein